MWSRSWRTPPVHRARVYFEPPFWHWACTCGRFGYHKRWRPIILHATSHTQRESERAA